MQWRAETGSSSKKGKMTKAERGVCPSFRVGENEISYAVDKNGSSDSKFVKCWHRQDTSFFHSLTLCQDEGRFVQSGHHSAPPRTTLKSELCTCKNAN